MLEAVLSFFNGIISALISASVNWNIDKNTTSPDEFKRKVAKIAFGFGLFAFFINLFLIYYVFPRTPVLLRDFQFTYKNSPVDSLAFESFSIEGGDLGITRTKDRIFVKFPALKNEVTCTFLPSSGGFKFKIFRNDPEVVNIDERKL